MALIDDFDGFYDAAKARQIAMGQASGNNQILTEINLLQAAVDTAASAGNLEIRDATGNLQFDLTGFGTS